MHVLITTGIFPPDIGGPATYVPEVAAGLQARGHRVTVVTLGDEPTSDRLRPYRVLRVRRGRALPLRGAIVLAAMLRAGRDADVMLAAGLYPESALASRLLRLPLVCRVVGDWVWERALNRGWSAASFAEFQREAPRGRLRRLTALRNWSLRRADAVIVPSEFLARAVAGWGIASRKVRVVANGVDGGPGAAAPAGPLTTRHRVITVCRLIALKRVDRLFDALGRWPADTGLVIVGDGPESDRLHGLATSLGLQDRVWFTGRLARPQSLALVAASDVLVLNSTHEGFPFVVVEAMHLGVPVVASDVGGVSELIEDGVTGRLVPPDDPGALVEAVAELLADPARRAALASRARTAAASHFGVARMIANTESVLVGAVAPKVPVSQ